MMKEFDGHMYYDDRLFLLHLCLGTVELDDEVGSTTIYYENPPPDAKWCLVTFRNCENYPAVGVLHFRSKDEATAYMQLVEPTTPLISLRGGQPQGVSYDAYLDWKLAQGIKYYDYRKCYLPGGTNPQEIIMQTRAQLLAGQNRIKETLSKRTV